VHGPAAVAAGGGGHGLLAGHKGREGQMIHLTSCNALQK